jgi:hypothetical protein
VSARAHAKICMHVRMSKFVCACTYQNLYPHVKVCMNVRMPKFVCACACLSLYARAHAKICMLVRMQNFLRVRIAKCVSRAHAKICMRMRIPKFVCVCASLNVRVLMFRNFKKIVKFSIHFEKNFLKFRIRTILNNFPKNI